jgi:hypothetical protein
MGAEEMSKPKIAEILAEVSQIKIDDSKLKQQREVHKKICLTIVQTAEQGLRKVVIFGAVPDLTKVWLHDEGFRVVKIPPEYDYNNKLVERTEVTW